VESFAAGGDEPSAVVALPGEEVTTTYPSVYPYCDPYKTRFTDCPCA
jgi:hypothetical protein